LRFSLSGIIYYLRSIPTLIREIRNWSEIIALAFHKSKEKTHRIQLRDGSAFEVRTLMDVWVLKETCLDRQYETFGTDIQNGWTVMDIGGGWGDFALSIGRNHPQCRVIAFEPFPPSIELFDENQNLNQVSNVELVHAAIGKESGKLRLSTQKEEAVQLSTADTNTGTWLEVESLSLADAMQNHHIERCDFLKMDCEGGEYDILISAPDDVLARIDRICMETHDGISKYNHADLIHFLEAHAYQVRYRVNPVHASLGMLYAILNSKITEKS
jgi:FkbM family methyltransferase